MVNETGGLSDRPKPGDRARITRQMSENRIPGQSDKIITKEVADPTDQPKPNKPHETEGDETGRLEIAKRQADVVTAELGKVQHIIDENAAAWESAGLAENFKTIRQAICDLVADVQRFVAPGTSGRPEDGLAMVTTASAVDDDLRDLRRTTGKKNPVGKLISSVLSGLQKAMRWLKPIILRLLTPKEWTISGQVTVLQWAGAEISVTFGAD